ncbi:hypothetical protein ANACAC_01141 [Anaerostipes caccae L1-92]|uniref:Uncharacterized protein n=1 Tax=Anaerostipes caccae (strain DSM 14662 / CCUG 47493 / JCM 13470 / NCIMB 13811 / L1-92) TaxID=411490 RepID=B0MC50_ANACD|nr:hypothetical protein ANACAC_01141 [Anaerostipes caccae L1-92]
MQDGHGISLKTGKEWIKIEYVKINSAKIKTQSRPVVRAQR